MMKGLWVFLVTALCVGARAEPATPLSALARMPVREITVFKDGHAFMLHEGKMPTDAAGNVQMDYLPTPVIGTFWPYSGDKRVKLSAVTANRRRVRIERTALSLRDLLEANPGTDVAITEVNGTTYNATVLGVPQRSADEFADAEPPYTDEKLPEKANFILLKTDAGVSAVPLERIQGFTFKGRYTPKLGSEEFRSLLTLRLQWPGGKPEKEAQVGMVYLQRGIRWIPGYHVNIDGAGKATIRMEATLINELADLDDVTANLVVGVPNIKFQETPDPMSLQQTVAQLSSVMQPAARSAYAFSNAIMTQQARMSDYRVPEAAPDGPRVDLGPSVAGGDKAEDLYVFTVKHITLRKGQRMVLPIAEFDATYKDVFTLDLPFAPPSELRANLGDEQQREMARLLSTPKVMHVLRLKNTATQPFTTAPALITRGDQVLAQGMMTYTPPGSTTDLEVTTAVDVRAKRSDKETARVPNGLTWHGDQYARADLEGAITLTNMRSGPVTIEVTRSVLGHVGKADHNGKAEMLEAYDDLDSYRPTWWGWYPWPYWWSGVNGTGRFTWTITIPSKQSATLGYTWSYYWR